jgi:hypothetical protein
VFAALDPAVVAESSTAVASDGPTTFGVVVPLAEEAFELDRARPFMAVAMPPLMKLLRNELRRVPVSEPPKTDGDGRGDALEGVGIRLLVVVDGNASGGAIGADGNVEDKGGGLKGAEEDAR